MALKTDSYSPLQLAQSTFESPNSSFYREHWNVAKAPEVFSDIMPLTWKDIQKTPFNKRFYSDAQTYVKVVHCYDKPFLIARTFGDIKKELYGFSCERPLVLFAWIYEGIEKSLWCFEHNILPLISENSMHTTAQMAQKYKIDSIISEMKSLQVLVPVLKNMYPLTEIKKLSIIDTSFNLPFLVEHFGHAEIVLRLGLPETGVFAETAFVPEGIPKFKADPHAVIETNQEYQLIVTRLFELPTPIIRYKTELRARDVEKDIHGYLHTFELYS